jgi:hypothetical protein
MQVCKLVAIALIKGVDKAAIAAVDRRYQHQEKYQIPISGGGFPPPDYLIYK